MNKILNVSLLLFFVAACTQFVEEEKIGENSYTGDDGCVYCHTNKDRLKALAPDTDDDDDSGGG